MPGFSSWQWMADATDSPHAEFYTEFEHSQKKKKKIKKDKKKFSCYELTLFFSEFTTKHLSYLSYI